MRASVPVSLFSHHARPLGGCNATSDQFLRLRTLRAAQYWSVASQRRGLANVKDSISLSDKSGDGTDISVLSGGLTPQGDHRPPDERTLKLGKTVRTLHDRLPTLLEKPLPQDILSPQISLHLFPSTHPHLPAVSGRIPYAGALWTAPVAWGRLPVLGNVKLTVLSERMFRNRGLAVSHECRDEKLIVKWKTCGKKDGSTTLYRGISASEHVDKLTDFLRGKPSKEEEFCGLFVFEFDDEGRICKHVIEHAEEGSNFDRATRVVSVTDWLLGKAPWRRREKEPVPGLAWCRVNHRDTRHRFERRRDDHR